MNKYILLILFARCALALDLASRSESATTGVLTLSDDKDPYFRALNDGFCNSEDTECIKDYIRIYNL